MELGERAKAILRRPAVVYASRPSTIERIFEMYERVPQPVYATAEPAAAPKKR
jgi:hypothetical protein